MNLDRELYVAISIALDAGRAIRSYQTSQIHARYKAPGELVTVADIEADSRIQAGVRRAFPKDAIFSEETPDSPSRLSNERVWIIDPLDSTSNFMEGGDEYSVSIGLSIHGKAILGVIYNPARDELFAGHQGRGVTLNGSPRSVTSIKDLEQARLVVSRKEWRRGLDKVAGTLPIYPMASIAYKLARVAAGLDDGMFSVRSRKQWDTCAGVALVVAAGGRASLLDGREIDFNGVDINYPAGMAAAGPELYPAVLRTCRSLASIIKGRAK